MDNHTNEIITGLIVSAGKSSRMGEFKPLMNYSGSTFIHQILNKLDTICHQIIIVTGLRTEKLERETVSALRDNSQDSLLSKIRFVENPVYEEGMFTSLKKGIKEIKDSDQSFPGTSWVIYHFVDQPGLSADFYSDFIKQIDGSYNWVQPSYKNEKGHPILLKKELFNIILQAEDDSNLREVSMNPVVKKKIWECSYKNILQDLDTPEDYQTDMEI